MSSVPDYLHIFQNLTPSAKVVNLMLEAEGSQGDRCSGKIYSKTNFKGGEN